MVSWKNSGIILTINDSLECLLQCKFPEHTTHLWRNKVLRVEWYRNHLEVVDGPQFLYIFYMKQYLYIYKYPSCIWHNIVSEYSFSLRFWTAVLRRMFCRWSPLESQTLLSMNSHSFKLSAVYFFPVIAKDIPYVHVLYLDGFLGLALLECFVIIRMFEY